VELGDNEDLVYQLDLQAQELCRLCLTWRSKLQPIPTDQDEFWGPSEHELKMMSEFEFNPSLEDNGEAEGEYDQSRGSSDDSGEDWAGVVHEDSDGDLIESLDALALSDEYREEVPDMFSHFSDFATDIYRASSSSPSKRPRALSP